MMGIGQATVTMHAPDKTAVPVAWTHVPHWIGTVLPEAVAASPIRIVTDARFFPTFNAQRANKLDMLLNTAICLQLPFALNDV
jgi:hypothetical protein